MNEISYILGHNTHFIEFLHLKNFSRPSLMNLNF
jgi:hypothetical protein